MLSFLQTERGPRGTAPGPPLGSQSMPVSVSDQPAVCVPVFLRLCRGGPGAPGAGRKGKDTRSPGPCGRTVAGPLCPCGACKSYAAKPEQRRKGRPPLSISMFSSSKVPLHSSGCLLPYYVLVLKLVHSTGSDSAGPPGTQAGSDSAEFVRMLKYL